MSEIYPVDDLVWNNKNEGIFFRSNILNLKNLGIDQLKEMSGKIDAFGLNDNQLVCELIGIAADNGSEWEDFRLSELKGLIALAVGEFKISLEHLTRTLLFGQISKEKNLRFSCLQTILEMKLSSDFITPDYENILSKLYSPAVYNLCQKILSGENIFSLLHSEFQNHKKLIEAHKKIMLTVY